MLPVWFVRVPRLMAPATLRLVRWILPILVGLVFSLTHRDLLCQIVSWNVGVTARRLLFRGCAGGSDAPPGWYARPGRDASGPAPPVEHPPSPDRGRSSQPAVVHRWWRDSGNAATVYGRKTGRAVSGSAYGRSVPVIVFSGGGPALWPIRLWAGELPGSASRAAAGPIRFPLP